MVLSAAETSWQGGKSLFHSLGAANAKEGDSLAWIEVHAVFSQHLVSMLLPLCPPRNFALLSWRRNATRWVSAWRWWTLAGMWRLCLSALPWLLTATGPLVTVCVSLSVYPMSLRDLTNFFFFFYPSANKFLSMGVKKKKKVHCVNTAYTRVCLPNQERL